MSGAFGFETDQFENFDRLLFAADFGEWHFFGFDEVSDKAMSGTREDDF